MNTEYIECEGFSLLLTGYHAGDSMSTACRKKYLFLGISAKNPTIPLPKAGESVILIIGKYSMFGCFFPEREGKILPFGGWLCDFVGLHNHVF